VLELWEHRRSDRRPRHPAGTGRRPRRCCGRSLSALQLREARQGV